MTFMTTRNLSREAHLWYTITSPDYVSQAGTKLQKALDFLQQRVRSHPFIADYAPVPHWGDVMEGLLDSFSNGLAILRQGEFGPMLSWASRMSDIPRGFRESNLEWLSDSDQTRLMSLLNEASRVCHHFLSAVTMSQAFSAPAYKDHSADWRHDIPEDLGIDGDGITRYYEAAVFPVCPEQIPEYAPDMSIECKTGELVPWTGVWVPSTGMGTAALAFARQGVQVMQPAYEAARMSGDGEDIEDYALIECKWFAVRPTGRMIPHPALIASSQDSDGKSLRCDANKPCPRDGFWFTPAQPGSRRYFKQGDLMPEVGGDYGATIWQRDQNQDAPG
jgi:hypothetical protein